MRKSIRYALVFMGGATVGVCVCGTNLVYYALSDDDIREALKNKISRKIDKALYGGRPRQGTYKVSYKTFYEGGSKKDHRKTLYAGLVFEKRDIAEKTLEDMKDIVDEYGFVTVADMYDLAFMQSPYNAGKYGWLDLYKVEIKRVREGYIIDLPLAIPIN